MEKSSGRLIVVTGPSGVGKGTILNEFFKNHGSDVIYSISSTTRKPRQNEIHGKNYFFISEDDFKKEIEQENFLEWAQYSGNYYGTRKSFVKENLKNGVNVILEIETQGAQKIMQKYPYCVSIFFAPPTLEELERRLRGRKTEDEQSIKKRLDIVKKELEVSKIYDYLIVNNEVSQALEELEKIYKKECLNANRG